MEEIKIKVVTKDSNWLRVLRHIPFRNRIIKYFKNKVAVHCWVNGDYSVIKFKDVLKIK